MRLKKCFSAPQIATPRANMLVEVAAALVEDDRAAETLAAVRPRRPGLSDGPGPAARAASPRPSLSSLYGRFVLRVALSCIAQDQTYCGRRRRVPALGRRYEDVGSYDPSSVPRARPRTRRRRRRSAKSRRLQNGAGCALAAAPPDPPVPSREAIFGRRAVEASGWDGRRPGGYRRRPPYHLSLPFPCISCLAVRCVRYPGLRRTTHAALGMRACCVRRSGCEQGGLRVVLAVVSAYKHREKCCPDCAGRCAREAKQPALLLTYTVSHASPSHRRHTCLTPTRLLHHLCMVTPVVSGTKNASSCNSCTHIANARGCTSPPP